MTLDPGLHGGFFPVQHGASGPCPTNAHAVRSLGSAFTSNHNGTGVTIQITVNHNTTAGSWLVVPILVKSPTVRSFTIGVTDSHGNSYTQDMPRGFTWSLGNAWTKNTNPLVAGNHITVHFISTPVGGIAKGTFQAQAIEVFGLITYSERFAGRYQTTPPVTVSITPTTKCQFFMAYAYNVFPKTPTHKPTHASPVTGKFTIIGNTTRPIYNTPGNITWTSLSIATYQSPTATRIYCDWSPYHRMGIPGAVQLTLTGWRTS